MDEKIYECHVRKLFLKEGVKRSEWVVMPVADALRDGATEFRCKDCHGAVSCMGSMWPMGRRRMWSTSPAKILNTARRASISDNTPAERLDCHTIPWSK